MVDFYNCKSKRESTNDFQYDYTGYLHYFWHLNLYYTTKYRITDLVFFIQFEIMFRSICFTEQWESYCNWLHKIKINKIVLIICVVLIVVPLVTHLYLSEVSS